MGVRYSIQFCLVSLCISFFVGTWTSKVWAQNDRLSRLQQARQLTLQTLDRVNQGAAPCYDSDCQNQKARLYHQIERSLSRATPLRENLTAHSVYRFLRSPRQELNQNPKTLRDWHAWWKRRYSLEAFQDAEWNAFFESVVQTEKMLQLVWGLVSNPFDLDRIAPRFDRDFREACRLLYSAVLLEEQANQAYRAGDEAKSDRLKDEADRLRDRQKAIEERMGRPLLAITRELLPDQSFGDSLRTFIELDRLMRLFGSSDLLHPDLPGFVRGMHQEWNAVFKPSQDFADLEYGVVGLNNLETIVNPVVAVQNEIRIQSQLDRVEIVGQSLIDLFHYSLLLGAARDFGSGSKLLTFLGLLGSGYAFEKLDWSVARQIFPSSTRTQELLSSLPSLEERLIRRKSSLEKTKTILETKLIEIDRLIETIVQGGESQ